MIFFYGDYYGCSANFFSLSRFILPVSPNKNEEIELVGAFLDCKTNDDLCYYCSYPVGTDFEAGWNPPGNFNVCFLEDPVPCYLILFMRQE